MTGVRLVTSYLPSYNASEADWTRCPFKRGAWNVNLIGVRSASRESRNMAFDDWIHVVFKDDSGEWVDLSFEVVRPIPTYSLGATQERSRRYGHPSKQEQYRSVWKIDLHQGKYEALCQRNGEVSVFRDFDRGTQPCHMSNDSVYDG